MINQCHGFPAGMIQVALLLILGASVAGGADHPLDTVTKRLPAVSSVTQVTEVDGEVLILTADPQGMIFREEPGGRFAEVETGLPGVSRLHRLGGTWCGLAVGKVWRSTGWPVWEEVTSPGPEPIVELRVLNGEIWGWTWGGLRWDNGSATRFDPKLYRTADVREWSEVVVTPDPAAAARSFSDMAWAAGGYVLTGDAYQQVDGVFRHAGGLWSSVDGESWQRETEVDGRYTSVTFGGGSWLAGGSGQTFAVSTDGTTWTKREHSFVSHWIGNESGSSPQYSPLLDVGWLPSGYHALVSLLGRRSVVVSEDGFHWSTGAGLESGDVPEEARLTTVGGKVWLWGGDGTVWSSGDWRWGAERILPEEPSDWRALAASPERAVVLGDDGRAGWSADGAAWNFVPLPGRGAIPVAAVWAADRGEFLAVGTSGSPEAMQIWRSEDGEAWGGRTSFGGTPVGLVRGAGNYVVAMADGWIQYSTDGLTWKQAAVDASPEMPWPSQGDPLQALAYDGETFVALELRGGLVVSTDGVSWTSRAGPEEFVQDVKATLCGANGFWLYGANWTPYFSDDLVNWRRSSTGVSSEAWIHAFGEFVGVGLVSTTDGVAWSGRGAAPGAKDLALFQNTVVLAGENGAIYQTAPWIDFVAAWRAEHFSLAQLADPAVSGDDRDPDRDGLPNLLEYACGLDPWAADAREAMVHSDRYYVPQGTERVRYLAFEFPIWESSPGVSAWVEHSTDLRTWSRTGLGSSRVFNKLINGREVWRRELQVGGGGGFLRMRAERATIPLIP